MRRNLKMTRPKDPYDDGVPTLKNSVGVEVFGDQVIPIIRNPAFVKSERHNLGQVSLETEGDGQRPKSDDLDGTWVTLRAARRLALECLAIGVLAGAGLGFCVCYIILHWKGGL
jgi:hypothetical protein